MRRRRSLVDGEGIGITHILASLPEAPAPPSRQSTRQRPRWQRPMGKKRYLDTLPSVRDTLAYGLRTRLREGYGGRDLRADIMAGLVVGVVALPLSMALAIASGVDPQYGL